MWNKCKCINQIRHIWLLKGTHEESSFPQIVFFMKTIFQICDMCDYRFFELEKCLCFKAYRIHDLFSCTGLKICFSLYEMIALAPHIFAVYQCQKKHILSTQEKYL